MILNSILNLDTSAFTAGLRSADVSLRVFERSIGTSSAAIKDFATLAGGIGLSRLAADAIIAGDEMINLSRRLSVLARSMQDIEGKSTDMVDVQQRAGEMFNYLRSTAIRTGTSMDSLAKSYTQLVPIGKSLGIATEDITDAIEGLIGATSLMGSSGEEVDRAFVALRQIVGKNALQMEELRGQLGEALPNAMVIMANGLDTINKKTGELGDYAKITTVELNKMITEGLIDGNLAIRAFAEGTRDFKKFADARGFQVTGQMQNMATIWKTGAGGFMDQSGMNTALAVGARQINTMLDQMFQRMVRNSEQTGQQIANNVLSFGDDVAKMADRLAPFNKEILSALGNVMADTKSFISGLTSSIPAEWIELGIIGLIMFGRTPVRMFGLINTTLTKALAGVAILSGAAISATKSATSSISASADMKPSQGGGITIDFDPLRQIFDDFLSGLKSAFSFTSRDPGTVFNWGEWWDKNMKGNGKSLSENFPYRPPSEGRNTSIVPKEDQKGLFASIGDGLRSWLQEDIDQVKSEVERQRQIEKRYGTGTGMIDGFLRKSVGVGLPGVNTEGEEITVAMKDFQTAYGEWKSRFLKDWDSATAILSDFKNMQSSVISSMTATNALKGSASEMLTLNKEINSFMASAAADPTEKLRSQFYGSLQKYADIERRVKGMTNRGVSEDTALEAALKGSGFSVSEFRSAKYMPILKSAAQFQVGYDEDETAANAIKQTRFFEQLGKEIEARAPELKTIWQQFSDRLSDDISESLASARDQRIAREIKASGRVVAELDRNAANLDSNGDALRLFDRAGTGDGLSMRQLMARQKNEQARIKAGDIEADSGVFGSREQAEAAAQRSAELNMTDQIGEARRRVNMLALEGIRSGEKQLILTSLEEQSTRTLLQIETMRANKGAYVDNRILQMQQSNVQSQIELATLQSSGGARAFAEGELTRLQLDVVSSRLKLEVLRSAAGAKANLDAEIEKLRLDNETTKLKLRLYDREDARKEMLKAESNKLEQERQNLLLQAVIIADPNMREQRDTNRTLSGKNSVAELAEELAYLQSQAGVQRDISQTVAQRAVEIQRQKNEIQAMGTAIYQAQAVEIARGEANRSLNQLFVERKILLDEEVQQTQRIAEIEGMHNEILRIRQSVLNKQDPAVIRKTIDLEIEKLKEERENLKLQLQLYGNPDYRKGKNENSALQGDVEMQRLLTEYSMTYVEYLRTNGAAGVQQFSSTLSDSLFQWVQGFKSLKDVALDTVKSIVGAIAKSGLDYYVKYFTAQAMQAFGIGGGGSSSGGGGGGGWLEILGAGMGSMGSRRSTIGTPPYNPDPSHQGSFLGYIGSGQEGNQDRGMQETLMSLNDTMLTLGEDIGASLSQTLPNILGSGSTGMMESIGSMLSSLRDWAGNLLSGLGENMGSFFSSFGEAASGLFSGVSEMISSLIASLSSGGGGGGGGAGGWLQIGMSAVSAYFGGGTMHTGGIYQGRFHSGGLLPSEGTAILQKGEMVVPRSNVKGAIGAMAAAGMPLPAGVSAGMGVPPVSALANSTDAVSEGMIDAMASGKVDIANYFSMEEVERHLARNPHTVVNIITNDQRNRGAVRAMIKRNR